jgi:hypothetical protein
VHKLNNKDLGDPLQRDVQLVADCDADYESVKEVGGAPEKAVRLAESFRAWGTDVSGREGIAACPLEHMYILCQVLARVVQQRPADRKTLERLVHLTTHPFSHRKSLISDVHF